MSEDKSKTIIPLNFEEGIYDTNYLEVNYDVVPMIAKWRLLGKPESESIEFIDYGERNKYYPTKVVIKIFINDLWTAEYLNFEQINLQKIFQIFRKNENIYGNGHKIEISEYDIVVSYNARASTFDGWKKEALHAEEIYKEIKGIFKQ